MILLHLRKAPTGSAPNITYSALPKGEARTITLPRPTLRLSQKRVTGDGGDVLMVGEYDLLVGVDRILAVP